MASSEAFTQTTENFISGSSDIVTNTATIANGSNLADRTVVGRVDTSGELIACVGTAVDGSEVPVGILVNAVDASGGAETGSIYVGGVFNPELLVWDASFSAVDKLGAFDGTNITLTTPKFSG